jgi:hypothetical protein
LAKSVAEAEELIAIPDSKIDGEYDRKLMICTRQWITAKELPRKYAKWPRYRRLRPLT